MAHEKRKKSDIAHQTKGGNAKKENAKEGKAKKRNAKGLMHEVKNTIYILKLVYSACPKRAVLSLIKDTLGSCRWAIYNVVFLRLLINALSTGGNDRQIYLLLGVFAAFFLSLQIFFVYYKQVVVPETDQILAQNVNIMLYEKAAAMDLAAYETPDFYDGYTRALQGARENVVSTFSRVSILISMICSSLIIFLTTAVLDMRVLLFMAFPIISTFTIGNAVKKLRYKSDMENVIQNRKMEYVKRVAYYKEYANELRTSGIFDVLKRRYDNAVVAEIANTRKYGARISIFSIINDNLNYGCLTFGVVLYLLVRVVIHRTIDIGDFVVMVNSIAILARNLIGISMQIIAFSENNQYMDHFRKFMAQEPQVVSTGNRKVDVGGEFTITFENVGFSYGGQKRALRNVSFTIKSNQKNAIVGFNGAGKTTLIKLLLRFYDPEEGRILLNGTDIREYDLDSYRGFFGVCFQDYKIFAAPLAENVLMRRSSEGDGTLIEEALRFSGLEEFAGKKDHIMTKEFSEDGLVFSGGQGQRLSIARAYAKNTPALILDEPTSALDPIAEDKIYQKIEELCKEKLVVFVTHHLGSCMSADRILYMDEGRLAEEGTFEELMENKSYFYRLFSKQRGGYTNEAGI